MKKITLQQLKDLDACQDQVDLFADTFGDEVIIKSEKHARKLADKYPEFDYGWIAVNMLSEAARAEYKEVRGPAWAEYQEVLDAAFAEYEKALEAALAEHRKGLDSTWASYLKVRASALAEYEEVRGPAWAEYRKVRAAAALVACYNQEK